MSEQQFWTKFFQSQYFLQKNQPTEKKGSTVTPTSREKGKKEEEKDQQATDIYTTAHRNSSPSLPFPSLSRPGLS
jgi:hypothetical protein